MKTLTKITTILLCMGLLMDFCKVNAVDIEQGEPYTGSLAPVASMDGSFVITDDGVLWACGNGDWGTNQGAYGGPEEALSFENPNKLMEGVAFVKAGQFAAMAIDRDGTLWGWGSDNRGQLQGHDDDGLVRLMEEVRMASLGTSHAVALTEDGTVWTWGKNGAGQFAAGAADNGHASHPPQVTMRGARYALASGDATYVIQTDGSLWGWGGYIPIKGVPNPCTTPVKLFDSAVSVASSDTGLFVLKPDGSLWAEDQLEPDPQTGEQGIRMLDHVVFCNSGAAIQTDGTLWLWDMHADLPVSPWKAMEDALYAEVGIDETIVVTDEGALWAAPIGRGTDDSSGRKFQLVMEHVLLPQTADQVHCIPFQDVWIQDWFYPYVKDCYRGGWLMGVSEDTFSPNTEMTEKEAVTIAVRLHQSTFGTEQIRDNESDWFAPYRNYALGHQILLPGENTPADAAATRSRLIQLLGRALPEEQLAPLSDDAIDIPDVDETTDRGAVILRFYQAGILTGADLQGSLYGEHPITRAETAAIVSRTAGVLLRLS